jgi:prophage maintenance system killer protein
MSINDIDQSIPKDEEKVEIGIGSKEPISQPVMEEMIYKKVGETLGLENFSEMEKYKDQIKMIAEYVKGQGSEDIMDFEWAVKQLEQKVASPAMGEKRITNLARYVYLLTEDSRIKAEIDKMGGMQ